MRVLTAAGLANRAFQRQKRHARLRGTPFHFSYIEWRAWWERELGPLWMEKRGCRRGQYVMARLGDQGAYEPGNVKCVTCSENQSEQKLNGTTGGSGWNLGVRGEIKKGNKLSQEAVAQIYLAEGTEREIAVAFGVNQSSVSRIKTKKLWRSYTNQIDGARA